MEIKQKTILRAALGWQIGILVGMYGGLAVMIFLPMNIYLKVFTVIGLFSASLGTLYSIFETFKQYKMFMEFEKINNEPTQYFNSVEEDKVKGGH